MLLPESGIYCSENTCVIFRLRVLGRFIHHCGNMAQTLYTREAWYEIQEGCVSAAVKRTRFLFVFPHLTLFSLCRTLSRSHTCFSSSLHPATPLFIRHPRALRIVLSDRTRKKKGEQREKVLRERQVDVKSSRHIVDSRIACSDIFEN